MRGSEKIPTQMYIHSFRKLFESVKAAWRKFGIEVWPGVEKVKDRAEIVEFTRLELEDEGGFPVNSPDCQVLDQSVNHTWKNLKEGLNAKFQKRKPCRRTNGGFVNDVLSSWEEMKIEHIRNAIDAQRGVMLEIIEKQVDHTTFLSSNTSCKT